MTPANSGAVSAKLLPDPNAPQADLAPGEEFIPPQLDRANPLPAYPSTLLALHLGKHTVATRVFFDESGKVYDIVDSPVAASTDDIYLPQFKQAVRDTLSQWKCWPPRIRKFRPGPPGEDGKPDFRIMVYQRVLKTFFDVAFSFEVVDGKPVVKPAL